MSFCSVASLVGGVCGPSPENPEVDKFVYVKDCDRDVKAHLKLCKILTNIESIDSERKFLLTRAGKYNGIIFFLIYIFLYHCIEKRLLIFYLGIFVAHECQLHMTICPKHWDACGIRWRTGKARCCVPTEVAGHKSAFRLCLTEEIEELTASNLVLFLKKRACLSPLDHVSID